MHGIRGFGDASLLSVGLRDQFLRLRIDSLFLPLEGESVTAP